MKKIFRADQSNDVLIPRKSRKIFALVIRSLLIIITIIIIFITI